MPSLEPGSFDWKNAIVNSSGDMIVEARDADNPEKRVPITVTRDALESHGARVWHGYRHIY